MVQWYMLYFAYGSDPHSDDLRDHITSLGVDTGQAAKLLHVSRDRLRYRAQEYGVL